MRRIPRSRLAAHTAHEFVLTGVLLFCVVGIVRVVIGPSPISRAIPGIQAELVLVGVLVALLIATLIQSAPGRASGGHMNPAISFAMWRFGVFPASGVIPYVLAQLLGSLFGVTAAGLLWGPSVAAAPVRYAVLQPAPGWTPGALFAAEAGSMAAIVLVVGGCLSSKRLSAYIPWIVGALVGAAIALLGTSTGGSVNPARQFGPALLSGQTAFLWVYLTAPLVGAALAAFVREAVVRGNVVRTHHLSAAPWAAAVWHYVHLEVERHHGHSDDAIRQ